MADMFLALDKDMNGTLSKPELREYADGTLTDIFVERGLCTSNFLLRENHSHNRPKIVDQNTWSCTLLILLQLREILAVRL